MDSDQMKEIKHLLEGLDILMKRSIYKIDELEMKINILSEQINGDISKECKKMGGHIDFVEAVYDKIKYPLGFFFNRIPYVNPKALEDEHLIKL